MKNKPRALLRAVSSPLAARAQDAPCPRRHLLFPTHSEQLNPYGYMGASMWTSSENILKNKAWGNERTKKPCEIYPVTCGIKDLPPEPSKISPLPIHCYLFQTPKLTQLQDNSDSTLIRHFTSTGARQQPLGETDKQRPLLKTVLFPVASKPPASPR